jgi:GTP-binding protein
LTSAGKTLFAKSCDFFWGTGNIESLPPSNLPEVAFVGRSNAGKSSLLNALTNRKTLARVSHTPGRTRELNFFNLGGAIALVDLPGYGYAKASKTLTAEWQDLIFAYLSGRANLNRVLLLIDSRRGVMDIDHAVMDLLDETAVSYCLVLTKLDELKPAQAAAAITDALAHGVKHKACYPEVFATSSQTRSGLEPLQDHIAALASL